MSLTEARAATPVALAYEAAPGCPSEADFKAAVEARDGHFTGERAPGSAWALRVSIDRDDAGFRGTLQSTTEETTSALREVHGATCQEVVDALAVVSATALNPRVEASAAVSKPPPAAPQTASTNAPATAPPPAPDGDIRLRAHGEWGNGNKKVQVEAGTLRFDLARSVLLSGGAQFGLLPHTVVPRYDLSLNVANFVTTPGGKSFLNGAIPRVHVSYLGPSTYRGSDASSKIQGFLAAIGVCWSPIYDTRGWAVLLCGEYGVGVMQIRSTDAQGNRIQNRSPGFGFAGLGLEAQYHFGSVFELGLKVGTDMFIDSFSAERPDGSQIFQSSQFTGYGMLGLGVQF